MSTDYYQILGVSREADSDEIKRAYKKLALEYHPDRNPGDHEAEEKFKIINTAYQVLGDAIRRSKYNHQLEYEEVMRQRRAERTTYDNPNPSYSRPPQPPQKRKRASAYKIDKEYYRVQKIILLIFLLLIGSAYGLRLLKDLRAQWQEEERILANEMLLDSARMEFGLNNYDKAFSMIDRLISGNITDYNYYVQRDSMLFNIREKAMLSFNSENYNRAAEMFKLVRKYEWRERTNTLELLSASYARAGNGSEASRILIEKLSEEPNNLSLLFYTAHLHYKELNNPRAAMPFLERGKFLFKDNNEKMYGKAFEFIVKPDNMPDVYYDIYELSSRLNTELGNYEVAYTDCNWAIFIRPGNPGPYSRRIETGILTGQTSRVCRDLNTLSSMGIETDPAMVWKYCNY